MFNENSLKFVSSVPIFNFPFITFHNILRQLLPITQNLNIMMRTAWNLSLIPNVTPTLCKGQYTKLNCCYFLFNRVIIKSHICVANVWQKRCKSYLRRRYNWQCRANPTDKYASQCSRDPSQRRGATLHWKAYLSVGFVRACQLQVFVDRICNVRQSTVLAGKSPPYD